MEQSLIFENDLIMMIFAGALGAVIGSFLNVVIYRLPNNKSIVTPPSSCPKCDYKIKWYDNIPMISYILLLGKCRKCKTEISLRYPGIEFLTAAMFVLVYGYDVMGLWNPSPADVFPYPHLIALIHMAFVATLIAITFIDFDHRIIPDEMSIGGSVVALIIVTALPDKIAPTVGFASEWTGAMAYVGAGLTALIGGLTGSLLIWLTGWLGAKAFKKEAMGFGDVKLMFLIGALLGWQAAIIVFFTAPCFGLFIAIPRKFITGDSYIAYGPFLSLAAVVFIFCQDFYLKFLDALFNARPIG